MSDFDPEAYAAREAAPIPVAPPAAAAPAFDPEAYAGAAAGETSDLQLGVMPVPPAPPLAHVDPAVTDELHARVDARLAGEEPPPRSDTLQAFRDANVARNAALANFKATNSGLSADQGAEALQQADAAGLGPAYVAKNLDDVRQQNEAASFKAALTRAPVLASFAAQSPAHAAAVKSDADNLGFFEWLFNGIPKTNTVPSWDGSYTIQEDTGDFVLPPAWESFYSKGLYSLKQQLLGLKQGMIDQANRLHSEASKGGLSQADTAAQLIGRSDLDAAAQATPVQTAQDSAADRLAARDAGDLAAAEVPGTKGSLGREMVGASIEAAPQLAGFMGGAAPSTAFLFAQTYGQLHNHFSDLLNADGSRKFTDDQVRDLSTFGGVATATVLGGLGAKFVSGLSSGVARLLPKAAQQAIGEAGGSVAIRALTESPALTDNLLGRLLELKTHMLHGLGFMLGQAVINDLTDQAGELMTGGKFDVSKTVQAAQQSVDGAMMLLPLMALGPAAGTVSDVGRSWKAHADALDVASAIQAAKESKFIAKAPEQAQPLLEAQAKAGDPARSTAFIPVAAFDAAVAAAGRDAGQIAASFSDNGAAYHEAKITGGDIAVPMADVLGKLAPAGLADALLPDIRLDPESWSLREAQQYQEAWHGSPHQFAQFETSHLGTGEGSHAYGRGLYFAEVPAVAKSYARTPTTFHVEQDGDRWRTFSRTETADHHDIEKLASFDTKAEAEADAATRAAAEPRGRVYRAAIPHGDELLDYDKPLSEQPPEVRKKLEAAELLTPKTRGKLDFPPRESTGKDLSEMIGQEALSAAGIPGLKYLDAGSRDGIEGTRNFVIWDASRVRMLANDLPFDVASRVADIHAPIDLARLKRVADRGLPAEPSEAEIAATMAGVRGLGFDVPVLDPLKVEGLGGEQPKPPRAQSPALAEAAARAKDARDLDTALQAYAADRISKLPLGQIRPETYRQQAKVAALRMAELAQEAEKGRKGASETRVITPQNKAGEPAHYRVVEAANLIASHNEQGFGQNPEYPAGVQERDYRGEQHEQSKVSQGGANLNPALVLSDTPTAVDGPPLVTSGDKAFVMGGNGRSMMIRRAYADGGEPAEQYKKALQEKAAAFGIDPAEVAKMKQPVLVRTLDGVTSSSPKPDMVSAVRRFNEGMTQGLSPKIRAVAEARVLTPQTVQSIGELFGDGDTSLRELLRERPQDFVRILTRDGIINDQNRPTWAVGDELTDEGKDRIEGMFLGRVMGSGERLQATAPSLTAKVERAVPSLLRVEGANPEAGEVGDVQGALDLLNEAARRQMPLDDLLDQRTMFVEGRVEPRTIAMARLLQSKSAKDIASRFKTWADIAAADRHDMFAKAPPIEDALPKLFAGMKDDISGESRPADQPSTKVEEKPKTETGPVLTPQAVESGKKAKAAEASLSEVQTQHRVADHLADAAAKAKEAAAKISGYLKERAADEVRGKLQRADREVSGVFDGSAPTPYTDAHDAILQALGFRGPDGTPKSIDAGVARIASDDRLNFDPEALKTILGKQPARQMNLGKELKGSLDGLTLEESKLVQVAVQNIGHAATAAIEVVRDEQRAQYADDVQGIRDFGKDRPRPPPPSPSEVGKSGIGKVVAKGKAIFAGMLKPELLMRQLGPIGEAYFREYLRGRYKGEELARLIGERVQNAIDAMPDEVKARRFDKVEGPSVGKAPDGQPILNPDLWSRQDLMMLWAWMGTESSATRAAKGLGTTEAEIHRALGQLSKQEKDFIQSAIWDVNDQVLKPRLLEQTAKNTGTPMETVDARPITTKDGEYPGGFHHASYNHEASEKAAARTAFSPDGVGDYYGDLKGGWAVGPANGFTKSRINGAFDVPNLNWSSYPAHVQSVIHYLAVDDFVKAFGGLLRRPDARSEIKAQLGPEGLRQLDEFLKTEARGGVDAPQGGFDEANRLAGSVLRSRAAQTVFTLNVKTWLQQFSHVIAAAPALRFGPGSVLYGLGKALSGEAASLAGFTADHLAHGMGEALRPLSWAAARDASATYGVNELGNRWDRFTDKQRQLFGTVGPGEKPSVVGRVLDAMNWSAFHVIDGFLSQWLWHASDLKNRNVPIEQRASINDQVVRDAMPPMNLSELSSFARDRGFIGSMFLTKRFQTTLFNLQEAATWQARTKAFGQSSQGMQRATAVTGYAANAFITYQAITMGAHMLGRYLGGHGRKKDEGETGMQWALRQWLIGNAYPLPFGEELATPLVEHLVDGKPLNHSTIMDSLSRMNPAMNLVADEYADVGDAVTSHKPTDERMWKGLRAALRVATPRAPLPLINQVRSSYDVLSGKTHPRGPLDAGSKLVYSPRPGHAETNPLSDLSRAVGE